MPRALDLKVPRRFFLGVLGWTPDAALRQARLVDLADAWAGHAGRAGFSAPVSRQFMAEMMQRFPDKVPHGRGT